MALQGLSFQVDTFRKALKQSLAPQGEQVLLIGDKGIGDHKVSPFLTHAFSMACDEEGMRRETYYQNTKARGEAADPVLIRKLKRLPRRSIIIVNVSNRLGTMEELGYSFRSFAKEQGHRFISASSLGTIAYDKLGAYTDALDVDYKELQRRSARLKKLLDDASEASVTTKAGTDLVYGIEGMTAHQADGVYHEPGTGGNLPGAETYIAPYKDRVEGVAVIDGSARVQNGTLLIRSPTGIRLIVERGVITSMNRTAEARQLEATLAWAHRKSRYPWGVRRVGELGIGLNPKARIIGAMILDEKVLGTAHLAIGSNQWFGGSVYSIIHLDQVMRDVRVKIGSRLVNP
ncbi:aminopeptidase [Candidatus Woesearchaeota archaeon]|nr:aminopeptidase [Candidatus Woesearchaeota archaeon]